MTFYLPQSNEIETVRAAYACGHPVMLLGPTGCGKTRLVRYMAQDLGRPMVTVACHDDLTVADLVGRFLVSDGDVEWVDGPLTRAVRTGAVCYLDEVVEARRDTLAVLHSLTDDRRELYLDRTGEVLPAPSGFMLVASYNPTTRSLLKELKPSFRQRFVTVELEYLDGPAEVDVVMRESGIDRAGAEHLVRAARGIRAAEHAGVLELPGTRLLVTAAQLIVAGLDPQAAIGAAMTKPLSSGRALDQALQELLHAAVGETGRT